MDIRANRGALNFLYGGGGGQFPSFGGTPRRVQNDIDAWWQAGGPVTGHYNPGGPDPWAGYAAKMAGRGSNLEPDMHRFERVTGESTFDRRPEWDGYNKGRGIDGNGSVFDSIYRPQPSDPFMGRDDGSGWELNKHGLPRGWRSMDRFKGQSFRDMRRSQRQGGLSQLGGMNERPGRPQRSGDLMQRRENRGRARARRETRGGGLGALPRPQGMYGGR